MGNQNEGKKVDDVAIYELKLHESDCIVHCHTNNGVNHADDKRSIVSFKLKLIILICTLFMAIEIAGGFIANSIAIITDAFHLLSDLCGFLISFMALKLSQKHATKRFNLGYQRFEILGAFMR